jgi:hypothetical protein
MDLLNIKYNGKQEQFEGFYNTQGRRFISRGDYNAKHANWGPKGLELLKTMESNICTHIMAIWQQ